MIPTDRERFREEDIRSDMTNPWENVCLIEVVLIVHRPCVCNVLTHGAHEYLKRSRVSARISKLQERQGDTQRQK